MKTFYWIALNISLLLLSACNTGLVKEAPSLTDVNSGKVIQAQAKITDLQRQLDTIKIAPALDKKGQATGKIVWEKLGGKCPGKSWYHQQYCPNIQQLESQIQSQQAIVNRTTRRVADRGDRKIFSVLPSTAEVIPKARIPGGIAGSTVGQTAQTVQNCDIQANVAPRVLDFLSCKVAQIIAQPDHVNSFLVELRSEALNIPERNRLGRFPIAANGKGLNLKGPNLKKFQALVFAENSYVFDMDKRCRFRPEMGLHFVKGNEAVEIIFSVSCPLWLFIYGNDEKLEDFDPIFGKLAFLNTLFSQQLIRPVEETQESSPELSDEHSDVQGQHQPIGTIQGNIGD